MCAEAVAMLNNLGIPLALAPTNRISLLPAVASKGRSVKALHRHLIILVRTLDVGESCHVLLEPPQHQVAAGARSWRLPSSIRGGGSFLFNSVLWMVRP